MVYLTNYYLVHYILDMLATYYFAFEPDVGVSKTDTVGAVGSSTTTGVSTIGALVVFFGASTTGFGTSTGPPKS
jgi:hypothetical protein